MEFDKIVFDCVDSWTDEDTVHRYKPNDNDIQRFIDKIILNIKGFKDFKAYLKEATSKLELLDESHKVIVAQIKELRAQKIKIAIEKCLTSAVIQALQAPVTKIPDKE